MPPCEPAWDLFPGRAFFVRRLLGFLLACLPATTGGAWTLTPALSLTHYALAQSHPFFGEAQRHWLETSLALGGKLRRGPFTAALTGMAISTTGTDPYGTVADAPALAVDEAYIQWQGQGRTPWTLTLGRQPIELGTQFLIGDGISDGYGPRAQQGVYHNPRRGFDALRLQADLRPFHLDALYYRVDPTWDGGGGRDGRFGGLELSRHSGRLRGDYAAGLFYRYSHSDLDNDMALLDLRAEQPLPRLAGLSFGGEYVRELGTGWNAAYVTTPGQSLAEAAWHAELSYQDSLSGLQPFAEMGYVYYSQDFTPVATGFPDWGKWFLGNQIDWIVFGSDCRIAHAQLGCWPHSSVKVRGQYFHTRLIEGRGALSDEFSLIGEWYPREGCWINLLVGYARPGSGLAQAGLSNPFAALNPDALPVGGRASLDWIFACGVSF